jgi:type I restriction enzyme, S subunit
VKSNLPEVRFPGFSGDWEECKLGEMVDFFNEKRIPIDSEKRIKGQYPYYGATGIIDYVEGYIFKGEYVLLAEDGANITTRNSPIAYLAQGEFWVNNHAHIMKMKSGSNFFLVQLLEKQNYDKYNTGTAQPKLNGQVVKNIILNFPSEKEQIKVGKIFESLERSIALHQQELTTLKQTKRGFLQKMFPREGESVPEIRFPGFSGMWEVRKLDSIVDKVKSYSLSRDIETSQYTGYKYIHYGDIHTKVADIIDGSSNLPNIKIGNYDFLEKGDLVLADASEDYQGIATPAVITVDLPYKLVSGLHTIALRPKPKVVNSLFLYYLINSPIFRKYGYKAGTGMKVFGISATNLLKFESMFPVLEEQTQIGIFLKRLDDTIALYQSELDALKETKKAFLQKMFV